MTTRIQITNTNAEGGKSVVVVVQSVLDEGRELRPNGEHTVIPGETQDFIVHKGQSVRVIEPGA